MTELGATHSALIFDIQHIQPLNKECKHEPSMFLDQNTSRGYISIKNDSINSSIKVRGI